MQTWTIKALLDWITPFLGDKQVDAPRLCAEFLMCHVLGKQRIELYTQFDQVVPADQLAQLRALVKRASDHEPVAYLVGKTEFYSLELNVRPGCLIPRPETEMLVQHAIELLRTRKGQQSVLDLCTGSGCIAAAIAHNVKDAHVTATDLSQDALDIAAENCLKHRLSERITLLQGDLLSPVASSPFDLIVSNPPYVSEAEYAVLDKNVKEYEPREALLAGPKGLDIYERLLLQVESHLKPDGVLMLEIGYLQGPDVVSMLENTSLFSHIQTYKDMQNHDRLVVAIR
ncbi:MAG: peptide chain release factor N(5)-glutamine methyltransferase [Phycisphaerae bacterium]|nr:peptide chain release factor N(5)-glutamine methyltransferase [Phycisphaerae bacterium]